MRALRSSQPKRSLFSTANSGRTSGLQSTNYSGETAVDSAEGASELFTKIKDDIGTTSEKPSTQISQKFADWVSRQSAKLTERRRGVPPSHTELEADDPPPPYTEREGTTPPSSQNTLPSGEIRQDFGNASQQGSTSFGLVLGETGRPPRLYHNSSGPTSRSTFSSDYSQRLSNPYANYEDPDYSAMGLPPSRPLSFVSESASSRFSAYSLTGTQEGGFQRFNTGQSGVHAQDLVTHPYDNSGTSARGTSYSDRGGPWAIDQRSRELLRPNTEATVAPTVSGSQDQALGQSRFSSSSGDTEDSDWTSGIRSSIKSVQRVIIKRLSGPANRPRSVSDIITQGDLSRRSSSSRLSAGSIMTWAQENVGTATSNSRQSEDSQRSSFGGMTSNLTARLGKASQSIRSTFVKNSREVEEALQARKRTISRPTGMIGEPTIIAYNSSLGSEETRSSESGGVIPPMPQFGSPVFSGGTSHSNIDSPVHSSPGTGSRFSGSNAHSATDEEDVLPPDRGRGFSDSHQSKGQFSLAPFEDWGESGLDSLRSSINSIADRYSTTAENSDQIIHNPTYSELHAVLSSGRPDFF
ncbi:hypothetical protein IAU59_005249 [Kwoniella sp. CBS 9459]